jgi:hypothetical protein
MLSLRDRRRLAQQESAQLSKLPLASAQPSAPVIMAPVKMPLIAEKAWPAWLTRTVPRHQRNTIANIAKLKAEARWLAGGHAIRLDSMQKPSRAVAPSA